MNSMTSSSPWTDQIWIGFDLETTGKYPVESEICEIAAVKWRNGQVIGEWSSLVKPSRLMSEAVIKIHNITNEMVADAPKLEQVLPDFAKFVADGYLLAHHAPFDLGFLTWEYEKNSIPLPQNPVICTSLLSRQVVKDSVNHRLQTLRQYFSLPEETAHRALSDALTCLRVGVECMKRAGEEKTVDQLCALQGRPLYWSDFTLETFFEKDVTKNILVATRDHLDLEIVYQGGTFPGKPRVIQPHGIIRNPVQGDFIVAGEADHTFSKRFLIKDITSARVVSDFQQKLF